MIPFHPHAGYIVNCRFSGLEKGEIANYARPVVILCPKPRMNKPTRIVACLSTKEPQAIMPYHLKLQMPDDRPDFMQEFCWLKGDMIYSVALSRLDLYHRDRDRTTGKRSYYKTQVNDETLKCIRLAVAKSFGAY